MAGEDDTTQGDNGTIRTVDEEDRQHQSTTNQHNNTLTTTARTQQTWQQLMTTERNISTNILRHKTGEKGERGANLILQPHMNRQKESTLQGQQQQCTQGNDTSESLQKSVEMKTMEDTAYLHHHYGPERNGTSTIHEIAASNSQS